MSFAVEEAQRPPFRRVICLAAVLGLIAGACTLGRGDSRPMQLRVLKGSATIHRGGETEAVKSEAGIQAGDRVVLSRSGIAQLNLAEGREFELISADVRVASETQLDLRKGSVLAALVGPGAVEVDGVRATTDRSTFRVDRAISMRTGVYTGSVEVRLGSERLRIPRLRQAVIAGGEIPGTEKPLRIDPQDRWDRRFLQAALDLDLRLANFGRGLEAQLGPGSGLDFFNRVLPVGDLGFLSPFLGNRRSDVLIGLAIAAEASGGSLRRTSRTFDRAFTLWNDGASWGLIAFELEVTQQSLFGRLLDALRRSGIFGAGGAAGPGTLAGGPSGASQPAPGGSGGGQGPQPSPSPSPSPSPTDPVQDLVEEIIGLLPSPTPSLPGLP